MWGTPRPGRVLDRVLLSTSLWAVSFSAITVVLPFRYLDLHLSIVEYGVTLAVYALGMLLTETLWGIWAFRLARPIAIGGIGLIVVGAMLLIAAATTYPVSLIAWGVYGAFTVYLAPLLRWVAVHALGPGTGGTGTGRFGTFFGLGLVAGTTLGPLLYVRSGFFSVVALGIVAFLASAWLVARIPWEVAGLPRSSSTPEAGPRALVVPQFVLALGIVFLYFLAVPLTSNFLQLYSVDLFHGTAEQTGYVLGAARATTLVASFVLGRSVDRRGPARSVPLGFLLIAAGALGTYLATTYGEMIGATLVFSAGTGWLSASILPYALEPIPKPAQGTAIGLFGSFEDLGLLLGPPIISLVWVGYGAWTIFPLVGGIGLAGFAVSLAGVRWAASVEKGETASTAPGVSPGPKH